MVLLKHNLYMLARGLLDTYQNTSLRTWMLFQRYVRQQTETALTHQLKNQQNLSVQRYMKGFCDFSDSLFEKHTLLAYHTADNLGTSAGLHFLSEFILGVSKLHPKTTPAAVYGFTFNPVTAIQLGLYLRARRTRQTGHMLEYLVAAGVVSPGEVFQAFGVEPNSPLAVKLYETPWTQLESFYTQH